MMKGLFLFFTLFFLAEGVFALPENFVYLRDVDPSILQDLRYAGYHNFVGRPIKGYDSSQCVLTQKAAHALANVQKELRKFSLSLKVYDCYRPRQAVDDFLAWSKDPHSEQMKAEFYPRVDKADLFIRGYLAMRSGHSRGSTVDLTIVPVPPSKELAYHPGDPLVACTASYEKRYRRDNSLDMGTGFDCLDELSGASERGIGDEASKNRLLLRNAMMRGEFLPYEKEWWHFTLKSEPYPHTYFNFEVRKWSAAQQSPPDAAAYFLTLADIHFDPFLECNAKPCPKIEKLRRATVDRWPQILSANETDTIQYRKDSNYKLVKSALSAAKHEADAKKVQFILILGDFMGHDFRRDFRAFSADASNASYHSFVNQVLTFLSREIAQAFPHTDVYAIVGNNDSYQGDYQSTPQGAFFKATATLWSPLIKNKLNRVIMQHEFVKAGYYAVTLDEHLRLIVLNTNLFSPHAKSRAIQNAANDELNWLSTTLKSAKDHQQKVWIAMHIPQGVDVYATKRLRLFRLIELWREGVRDRFQTILNEFSSTITGIFAGHIHLDWLQILSFSREDEIVESGTPSISPIFGNNPGFKVYQFSPRSFKLEAYTTYYFISKNNLWNGFSQKI